MGSLAILFLLRYFYLPDPLQMLPSLRSSCIVGNSLSPPMGPHLLPSGYPAYPGRVLPDPVVRMADRSQRGGSDHGDIRVRDCLDSLGKPQFANPILVSMSRR